MANKDKAPLQELFFRISGTGKGNWEIGRPQSVIIELVEQGVFQGEILDIGCGIADNAIYIATHVVDNVNITSIDMVPKAIEVARKKAQQKDANIQFEVINMLDDLSRTNLKKHSYDIILDAGLFQVFSDEDRQRAIKNLEYLIKPDGLYIQLCFSEKEIREGGPRRIKKTDLYKLFSSTNGWKIESIKDVVYETSPTISIGLDGRGYLSFIRRNKTVQP